MSAQEQVKPVPKKHTPDEARELAEQDAVEQARTKAQPDMDDLDELLDEIDGLLEEQEVLVNFRQKGGQ
jgi:hypothetical protein